MTCLECGYSYSESDEDAQRHQRIHEETMHGLRSPLFKSCQHAWHSGDRSVIVVNQTSEQLQRELAQRFSLIAVRDAQLFNVVYVANDPLDERDIHLFIGVEAECAQAYVCFERRAHVGQCTWDEYDSGVCHVIDGTMWSIGFAWVSRAHRRKGWVRQTVAAAAVHLGFGDSFGWYTPFTLDGQATARALCPSGIFIAK